MRSNIAEMVQDFEDGRLTRRQLVSHLAAMMAAVAGAGASSAPLEESPSTFDATGLNHVALNVTDIPRARDFYVRHLGMEVSRQSSGSCFLTCGENFVALFRAGEAGMNHYCYSVNDYDVGVAEEKLRQQGLNPRVEGRRIYFKDPEGLTVQLAAATHRP